MSMGNLGHHHLSDLACAIGQERELRNRVDKAEVPLSSNAKRKVLLGQSHVGHLLARNENNNCTKKHLDGKIYSPSETAEMANFSHRDFNII